MKTFWAVLAVAGLAAGVALFAAEDKKVDKKDPRVFELRTYYAAPGKMQALHARFRDHTCKLFEKHGMTIVGFWSPTDEKQAEQKLVYLLAFPSKEAADRSWQAFRDDPEWKAAREASEKDGKLVDKVESVFLHPTDYSPMK
jgi:hypothetical protein